MNPIIQIGDFIINSFLQNWPFLLVTIPIAVAVNMSGASRHINRAFTARPLIAIFLATFVGAFSPFCSCSVIPVVAALLIGGVPLAPVMSFWLASPSMDPEIFFLTVSSLGWELAVWRLTSTLFLSLSGGFITHFLVINNLLGKDILRDVRSTQVKTMGEVLKQAWVFVAAKTRILVTPNRLTPIPVTSGALTLPQAKPVLTEESGCSDESCEVGTNSLSKLSSSIDAQTAKKDSFWNRLITETWVATTMVLKFMLLAWFLGALIQLYVPESWIISALGQDNPYAILTAALLGVPVYTSNLAAMPLVGGLLAQGMHPAAALAFLISGPTTTLPAISAVWGLVSRKVFGLYVGFSLVGAVVLGYVYYFTL